MKTSILLLFVALFIVTSVFSQSNLNEYKYVVVSKQFSFLKEPNQYRVNGLAEFLFNKYNFSAFMEGGEYPHDYYDNRCLALKADVVKESGMFKTKLKVLLKNCNDQVIYTSPIGESRNKDFGKAYNEALRNAFKVFETMDYKYEPREKTIVSNNSSVVSEIQKLKPEIQTLKDQKEVAAVKVEETKVIENTTQVYKQIKVAEKRIDEEVKAITKRVENHDVETLYAQEIKNGYQLVDSSPKVVFKIKNTSLEGVYLVEGKNAIVYRKGSRWVVEFYENESLKKEILNIKF